MTHLVPLKKSSTLISSGNEVSTTRISRNDLPISGSSDVVYSMVMFALYLMCAQRCILDRCVKSLPLHGKRMHLSEEQIPI